MVDDETGARRAGRTAGVSWQVRGRWIPPSAKGRQAREPRLEPTPVARRLPDRGDALWTARGGETAFLFLLTQAIVLILIGVFVLTYFYG